MSSCPSEHELLEFLEGRASDSDSDRLAAHIAECGSCSAGVNRLSNDALVRECFAQHARVASDDADVCPPPIGGRPEPNDVDFEHTSPWADRQLSEIEQALPESLGRYRLECRLGAGACGVVYRAHDDQLQRTVALKLPRTPALSDPDARQRFLREARAAAGLHHPQIVALYDAGEFDGVFCLASAYTEGPTLSEWAAEQTRIAPGTAAIIVLALAEAVQHAHANGVLHRDIKPQNVLLDPESRFRSLPFCPKLTDFSIAKLLDSDGIETVTGMLLGTPRYMAPELAAGRRSELGPGSDVYGLGVVLYELLTGQVPIDGDGHLDTLRRVISAEITRPSRLVRDVPRDLEAICMTCLEKDPRRRYASAEALAADLNRFLSGRPTIARPMRLPEQVVRGIRRRPTLSTVIGGMALAVVIIFAGLGFHSQRLQGLNQTLNSSNAALVEAVRAAEAAEQLARQRESDLERLLYVSDMRLAGRARDEGDFREVTRLIERHRPRPGQPDLRGVEWHFLARLTTARPRDIAQVDTNIYQIRLAPGGDRLASVGQDGQVRVFDPATGRLLTEFHTGQGEVNGIDFSPDGRRIATAGDDGSVIIRDCRSGENVLTLQAYPELAFYARFTPDGTSLLTCGNDPDIHLWDARTGIPLGTLTGNVERVEAIAVSPDGQWAASGGCDGSARLWSLNDQQEVARIRNPHPHPRVMAVAFSADSRIMVAGDRKRALWVWDTASGTLFARGHLLDAVSSVAISPDGRWIVSGDDVGTMALWDLAAACQTRPEDAKPECELTAVRNWPAHDGSINSIEFLSGGEFATAGADGRIRVWTIPAISPNPPQVDCAGLTDVAFAADGRLLGCQRNQQLLTWSPATDTQLQSPQTQRCRPWSLSASRDGRRVVVCHEGWELECVDLTRPGSESIFGEVLGRWSLDGALDLRSISLSPDGRRLAVQIFSPRTEVRLFDPGTGTVSGQIVFPDAAVNHAAFTSDSGRIAVSCDDDILIWDPEDTPASEAGIDDVDGLLRIPATHTILRCFAFSPDDSLLATCGVDRLVRLWDPDTGEPVATMAGHLDSVESLAFAPDGRSLLTAARNGRIKVWNVASGQELLTIADTGRQFPSRLTVSPDQQWLACILGDHNRLTLIDLKGPGSLPE